MIRIKGLNNDEEDVMIDKIRQDLRALDFRTKGIFSRGSRDICIERDLRIMDIIRKVEEKSVRCAGPSFYFNALNNYAFPETYKNLADTKIGKDIEADTWLNCYRRFLSTKLARKLIRLDNNIDIENWTTQVPRSHSHDFPADMSLLDALEQVAGTVIDTALDEGLAYLIQDDGTALIVSQTKAINHWKAWYEKNRDK